jgi:hypothetical protein
VRGISQALHNVFLDRQTEEGTWQTLGTGFGTGAGYNPAGQKVDVNYQDPGRFRFRVTGSTPATVHTVIDFTTAPAWPDPVQLPFDVSNMDFFRDLEPFAGEGQLARLSVDDVLSGAADLSGFDTIIAADDAFLPGFEATTATKRLLEPTPYTAEDRDAMAQSLRTFAENGGNLVLTDDSIRALAWMGLVPSDAVKSKNVYAGHVSFTLDGLDNTYGDPLATNMNPPGSSEGPGTRKQITEPVPLGYALNSSMPEWYVERAPFETAQGRIIGLESPCPGTTGCLPGQPSTNNTRVVLGEIPVGSGRVRILGSFLPWPTTEFPHNYGLSSYGLTFNGYELAKNLFSWERPAA